MITCSLGVLKKSSKRKEMRKLEMLQQTIYSRKESRCSHLNFRYRAFFEQGVPLHSGKYRV